MSNAATLTAMGEGHFDPEPTKLRLNLGCGYDIRDGWTNVDAVQRPGVDVVCDLDGVWPWGDSTVDEVMSSHCIEHVASFQHYMNELWRVLKPGGKAHLSMPHGRSDRATQDPTHQRILTEASFLYVVKSWREKNGVDYAGFACDFDVEYGYVYAPSWETKSDEARAFASTHYWNVVLDLHVYATAKK